MMELRIRLSIKTDPTHGLVTLMKAQSFKIPISRRTNQFIDTATIIDKIIIASYYIKWVTTYWTHCICPRISYLVILFSNLLYKMGNYFLDRQ